MIRVRHEEYDSFTGALPFSLGLNLERTPHNCSQEQNWHENLELQHITYGNGTVLLDGNAYSVKPGDICLVNSNEIHYTYTDTKLRYNCLIIDTAWCRQMGIHYESLSFSPKLNSQRIEKMLASLEEAYSDTENPLRIAKCSQILLSVIIELIEQYSKTKLPTAVQSQNFSTVKASIRFIRENYSRKLTLREISNVVLTDKYALCRSFKQYTGQTIVEYLNRYRCSRAIDCLQNGTTVSETAFLCGFASPSFFIKTFKKYTGHNPSFFKMR